MCSLSAVGGHFSLAIGVCPLSKPNKLSCNDKGGWRRVTNCETCFFPKESINHKTVCRIPRGLLLKLYTLHIADVAAS